MGKESTYCTACGIRLGENDFTRGRAFKVALRPYCLACLPAGTLPDPGVAAAPDPDPGLPKPAPRLFRDEVRPASTRRAVKPEPSWGSGIWFGMAALAVAVAGAIVWILLGSRAPAPPAEALRKPPPPVAVSQPLTPPKGPPVAPPPPPATPGGEEELAAWEVRVRVSLDGGRFKEAGVSLDEGRIRRGDSRWAPRVADLERELTARARERFQKLAAEAKAAAGRKEPGEVRRAREEIEAWGPAFARMLADFDRALEPPKPAEPAASPAALAYAEAWEKAMLLASRTEFRKATERLKAAGQEVSDDGVRAELAQDLKDLSGAQRVHSEVLDALPKAAAGTDLDLERVQEDGTRLAWRARVAKAGARRLELVGTPRFVEHADLTLGCLARIRSSLLQEQPSEEVRRGTAVLRALDGDADPGEPLPPKYAKYAALRRAQPPDLEPEARKKEAELRRLFYEAEVGFQSAKTRAASLVAFQRLLDEQGGSAFVEACRDEIRSRLDTAGEILFPAAGLSGDGIFKQRKVSAELKRKPLELGVWSSAADATIEGLENCVTVEFYAAPGKTYRGWVLVGGCCKATFGWLIQGTELVWVDPVSKKKVQPDPSGNVAVPLNLPLKNPLIPHAGAKHEKEEKKPSRWEWVELPLPKYASGGLKQIRLVGQSKGMAVGPVLISATRTQPPEEQELLALEEAAQAAAKAAVPAANPQPEDWLVLGLFGGKPSLPDPANVKLKYERSELASGPLEWKPVKAALSEGIGAKIDFHQHGIRGQGSAFAMIHVLAPQAAKAKLHYGHDDDLLLLVNGRSVKEAARWGTGTVLVDLEAGWNRVIFRIWDNGKPGGAFHASARFTDPSDQPIPGLGFDAYGPLQR